MKSKYLNQKESAARGFLAAYFMTPARTLRVFLPFAFGFYLSFLYRSVNAVISPDLIKDIGVDAANLGLLTSAYFIAFASSQVPLGIILDRIGSRKVEASLLIFAALGAVVFAISDSLVNLIIGRALIGFGVSACLMAAFKAFVDWFPKERIPLANGAIMMFGGLGAMTATAPIEFALQFSDWRGIFFGFAAVTLIASLAIYFIVPERPAEKKQPGDATLKDQIQGLLDIIKNPLFLRYVPISVVSQGVMLSIQSLWLGPWLRDVGGLSRIETANGLFAMAIAMACGFLSWGVIGERLGRFGISPMKISLCGMAVFSAILIVILFEPVGFLFPILILFGFFGTSGSLSYAGIVQHFPAHLSGRVYTTANLLVFVTAFTAQWGIGLIINIWPQTAPGQFSALGYQVAFATVLCLQLSCFAWVWIAKLVWRQK